MKAALLNDPVTGTHTIMIDVEVEVPGTDEEGNPTTTTEIQQQPKVCEISGNVSTASPNVRFNGVPVARVGDTVNETCECGGGQGVLITGSSHVFANGMPIAYAMSPIQTHGDECSLSGGGSTNVNIA